MTFVLCVVSGLLGASALSVVVNGVKFTTRGSSEASCRIANKADKTLTEIDVPASVTIDGLPYDVTSVEGEGFKNARHLVSVTLPNSIKRIGIDAFSGCSSLETIVLPDQARVDIARENYGFGGNGPFAGCVRLANVSGNRLQYPAYALTMAFRKCPEVPFSAEIPFLSPSTDVSVPVTLVAQNELLPEQPSPSVADSEPESEVDRNIPKAGIADKSRFAVIIGNQHYRGGVAEVEFANKDARVFAEYCKDALGIPESNVRLYTDATYGDMLGAMKDIAAIAAAYGGNIDVVFYYAGHGIPGESDRSAYLMPVDADGSMTEVCMPLDALYSKLAALDARSVLVFLDACFSGSQRGDGMLMAARGVQIKAKATQPRGRMVTFSAASGDQTAYPAKNEGHGIFTYYLLEKIKETRGEVTLGDLADHVITNVAQQSVVLNRKVQIPNVSASLEMADKWQQMKLR
ncbi:MAG: caspase family protein [Muribaculaceae bacterium]|nr:caspase family protein [Muribaculaceae bacterium]